MVVDFVIVYGGWILMVDLIIVFCNVKLCWKSSNGGENYVFNWSDL